MCCSNNYFAVYNIANARLNNKPISLQRLYVPEHELNDLILPSPIHLSNESVNERCEVIHVGLVCSGYKTVLFLHVMLKSIFFYRHNPVHFHIISNKASENILKTLFETWAVPLGMNVLLKLNIFFKGFVLVNVTFYNITDVISDVRWVPNSHYSGIYGLLKLTFPKLIYSTNKIIVLDTDLTFNSDIIELWRFFKLFSYKQVIWNVKKQSL